jgi:hypothetical protein
MNYSGVVLQAILSVLFKELMDQMASIIIVEVKSFALQRHPIT